MGTWTRRTLANGVMMDVAMILIIRWRKALLARTAFIRRNRPARVLSECGVPALLVRESLRAVRSGD